MMFEEYNDILTVDEACEAMRVGYNTIYKLLNANKLKGYRNGRTWRIPKSSLCEYIKNNTKM